MPWMVWLDDKYTKLSIAKAKWCTLLATKVGRIGFHGYRAIIKKDIWGVIFVNIFLSICYQQMADS